MPCTRLRLYAISHCDCYATPPAYVYVRGGSEHHGPGRTWRVY